MVKISLHATNDPTLDAMRSAVEAKIAAEPHRQYIGASGIGDECPRKIWYNVRYPQHRPYKLIAAAEDGHRTEALMAERLRMVPGITLYTEESGNQFGFDCGYLKGHYDGIITGLLQAPKTPHIWECKAVNERKFAAFQKIKSEIGEKNALEKWDYTYYCQAVLYMDAEKLTRHYLTVCTPGGRDVDSCRTEENPRLAKALHDKARRIYNSKEPPVRVSGDPSFYLCRMCGHAERCHSKS